MTTQVWLVSRYPTIPRQSANIHLNSSSKHMNQPPNVLSITMVSLCLLFTSGTSGLPKKAQCSHTVPLRGQFRDWSMTHIGIQKMTVCSLTYHWLILQSESTSLVLQSWAGIGNGVSQNLWTPSLMMWRCGVYSVYFCPSFMDPVPTAHPR